MYGAAFDVRFASDVAAVVFWTVVVAFLTSTGTSLRRV